MVVLRYAARSTVKHMLFDERRRSAICGVMHWTPSLRSDSDVWLSDPGVLDTLRVCKRCEQIYGPVTS